MWTALSVQGVTVRLTEERWRHIRNNHPDLVDQHELVLSAIESPDRVLLGDDGECIAVRELRPQFWLVVVYVIDGEDGFVVTAHRMAREGYFRERRQLWP
jgi:hypothetical protein